MDWLVKEELNYLVGKEFEIARALYNNPEILVFDEATSALDSKNEREVMNSIMKLKGIKTILLSTG